MNRYIYTLGYGLVIGFLVTQLTTSALAQSASILPQDDKTQTTPTLPSELTRETIRDVLSGLSDQQARDLLLQELDKKVTEAEAQRAAKDNRSVTTILSGWGHDLITSWSTVLEATPNIPSEVGNSVGELLSSRGEREFWTFPGMLFLCLGAGGLAAWLLRRYIIRHHYGQLHPDSASMWHTLTLIGARLFKRLLILLAFVAVAVVANLILNSEAATDSAVVLYLVNAIAWTSFAMIVARMVLAPSDSSLRLCAVDDRNAQFLTNRVGWIFGISAFGVGLLYLLFQFGLPFEKARLGFWISALVYSLIALTIWQARTAITEMIIAHTQGNSFWRRFAEVWPKAAIVIVALQWLLVELIVATGNLDKLSLAAMNLSLVVVLAIPLFEPIIRGLVEGAWPDDPTQEPALRAAHLETQSGLVRCGRIAAGAFILLVLAWMWGLNLSDLASQGFGAQLAGSAVEISVIAIVAYGLWELINIVADRQIAIENVAMGVSSDPDAQSDGEGGEGGSRLGTLMPLLRGVGKVAVVVLAGLAILGELGVNVTPLLAGAGIVGLAIGFGAQTLVKDIISGLFFLVDDAFRKGEYIDLGNVKGTVEKISIRSMQLRHHNGPLNTIPFGEITHLSNFSRDWVMMKLPLRVTYDTDVEKMRKLIKKLGQDLMSDSELGPKFLQPLKSQGVVQMEDSAMIVRVKFMTRPGDQWTIRNKVFARIRELFEKEGIKFAHREVTVRLADRGNEPLNEQERSAVTAAARSVVEETENKANQATDSR